MTQKKEQQKKSIYKQWKNPGQCPEQQEHRLRAMPITVKWMTITMTQEPRRKQVKKEMMKWTEYALQTAGKYVGPVD